MALELARSRFTSRLAQPCPGGVGMMIQAGAPYDTLSRIFWQNEPNFT